MLMDSQGNRLWIQDEMGGHSPVTSHADIQDRPRGKGAPDWWVVGKPRHWTPPKPKSLLSLGAAEHYEGAGGEHMKTGAGRKPQPYNPGNGEYEAGLSDGQVVRGRVAKPYEMREKASPRPGAKVIWKNDEAGKPDPQQHHLQPQMRATVELMEVEIQKLDSFTVNSGRRAYDPKRPRDPHVDGRAVDINNINGVRVVNLKTASGPEAERARQAAANLEQWAEDNNRIRQLIGPNGGWTRVGRRTFKPIMDSGLLREHKNHYHIGIYPAEASEASK